MHRLLLDIETSNYYIISQIGIKSNIDSIDFLLKNYQNEITRFIIIRTVTCN